MAFMFKPAIFRGGVLYELPRPVVSVRIQDAWDFEQFKVPLLDGEHTVGHSRQGVDVAIDGQLGSHEGALTIGEQEMFEAIEALRTALDVGAAEERYSLYLYHDAGTGTYRRLAECSTVRFEYDLSDVRLFTYAVVIHADDPVIYSTPG